MQTIVLYMIVLCLTSTLAAVLAILMHLRGKAAKDAEDMASMKTTHSDQEAVIASQQETIDAREATIVAQAKTIEDQRRRLRDRRKTINKQKATISIQEVTFAAQKETIATQQGTIKGQETKLAAGRQVMGALEKRYEGEVAQHARTKDRGHRDREQSAHWEALATECARILDSNQSQRHKTRLLLEVLCRFLDWKT